MKIEIENNKKYPKTFDVRADGKLGDSLTFDEMLGLVTQLTMSEERRCLAWLEPIESVGGDESSNAVESVRWYHDEHEFVIRAFREKTVVAFDLSICRKFEVERDECICKSDDKKLSTAEALCFLARSGWVEGWDAARELCGMTAEEAYLAGQSACGIDVGDWVTVDRVAKSNEMGWRNQWIDLMECSNTNALRIECGFRETKSYGLVVLVGGIIFSYPYFVLTKCDPPAPIQPESTSEHGSVEIDGTSEMDSTSKEAVPAEKSTETKYRSINTSTESLRKGDEYKSKADNKWRLEDTSMFRLGYQYRRLFNDGELESLRTFKEYVHGRLDDMGVPSDPNPSRTKSTGCRIGSRLDELVYAVSAEKPDNAVDESPSEPQNVTAGKWCRDCNGAFVYVTETSERHAKGIYQDRTIFIGVQSELSPLPDVGEWQEKPVVDSEWTMPDGTEGATRCYKDGNILWRVVSYPDAPKPIGTTDGEPIYDEFEVAGDYILMGSFRLLNSRDTISIGDEWFHPGTGWVAASGPCIGGKPSGTAVCRRRISAWVDDSSNTEMQIINAIKESVPAGEIDVGTGYRVVGKSEPIKPGDEHMDPESTHPAWILTRLQEGKSEEGVRGWNLVYRRKVKPKANQGDYVRITDEDHDWYGDVVRFEVFNPVTKRVTVSADRDNHTMYRSISGDGYEVVCKIIKPWTMAEACIAIGGAGMKIVARKQSATLNVRNIRADHACMAEGHSPTFDQLTYLLDANDPSLGQAWTLPDGSPCGNVEWEVVK